MPTLRVMVSSLAWRRASAGGQARLLASQEAVDFGRVEAGDAARTEAIQLRARAAGQLVGHGPAGGRRDGEAVAGEAGRQRQPVQAGDGANEGDLVDADRLQAAPFTRDRLPADGR